jgi:hypothetical protein
MRALKGRVSMSADVPGGEDGAKTGEGPRWHIVEHVPLPLGRALPPPDSADASHWGGGGDPAEPAEESDSLDRRLEDAHPTEDAPAFHADAPVRSMPLRGTRVPTTRTLFADLDRFLSQAAEASVSEHPALEYLQRVAAARQREARRARAVRLLVLALIVAIAVIAFVTIGVRLLHLGFNLPGS